MDMTRQIQAAVVRADMLICAMLRWAVVLIPFVATILLTAIVKALGGGR